MFSIEPTDPQYADGRDPRWPDPGTWHFVKDLMAAVWDINVEEFPNHVVPITIVSTLEWVQLNAVWILRNTGIYQTDEPYSFVFEYDQSELSPDDIELFRDAPERNQFDARINDPGLSAREQEEALGYVRESGFYMWEKGMTREQASSQSFTPPGWVIERVLWCTLMWVLSKNGRDWLYCLHPIVSSTYDYGVAYLYTESNELLEPSRVTVIDRKPHSCRVCEETLWCVRGALLDNRWLYVCVNCLIGLWEQDPDKTQDYRDKRILKPPCTHLTGINKNHVGTCTATCPHSGLNPEIVWELMEEDANKRVQARVAETKRMGRNPAQRGGVTLDNLIDYFEGTALPDHEGGTS